MSRFQAYIAEAFEAIWRNRTRSLLTMLGMIIGTSSIIAVLGISKAASGGITGTLNSFGDQGISIGVDPQQDDPNSAQIQYRDIRFIQESVGSKLRHMEPSYARNMTLRANRIKYATFGASGSLRAARALNVTSGTRDGPSVNRTSARTAESRRAIVVGESFLPRRDRPRSAV